MLAQTHPSRLAATPDAVYFHQVTSGQSKTIPVVIKNVSSATLAVETIGSSNAVFQVSGVTLPMTLNAGESITINLTFSPQVAQHVDAEIMTTDSASDTPLELPVHGTGVLSSLTANPGSLNFGNEQVGGEASQTVSVTNSGSHSITITSDAVSGSGFAVSGITLPATLEAKSSLTFMAKFSPTAGGSAAGSIGLVYSTGETSIALSGVGVAQGQLAASPNPLNVGSVIDGQSGSGSATLSASGSTVTITGASVSSSEFALSGITFPLTLTAGQSKTYSVTFTPQSSGSASATVAFSSNASNSASEAVSGTGTAPSHSVSLSWSEAGSAVAGYNVYRGTESGGPYSKINAALTPTTTYSDTTVEGGNTYYYAATSVGTDGTESAYSGQTEVAVPSP